jgi:hypothetical protein
MDMNAVDESGFDDDSLNEELMAMPMPSLPVYDLDIVPLGQWRGKKSKSDLTSAISDGSSEKKRTRKSKSELNSAVSDGSSERKRTRKSKSDLTSAVSDGSSEKKVVLKNDEDESDDDESEMYESNKKETFILVPPIDLGVTEIEHSDEFADNHQLIKASSIQAAAMLEHGEFRCEGIVVLPFTPM